MLLCLTRVLFHLPPAFLLAPPQAFCCALPALANLDPETSVERTTVVLTILSSEQLTVSVKGAGPPPILEIWVDPPTSDKSAPSMFSELVSAGVGMLKNPSQR
ncbi:PREDICTED: uncharacterized protein LOC106816692 [Priapulus caudatus]|uniref:Uncharacterized protein LOC106816692 n=1 Tax=Priapulus caudatus TaxID=37621 RepID=A0ABM1EX79_PRICU|nr:PREDICTED: uncharacterized protein LOC106816692 [Priapulus caudatus]